jgi:serine/threonine-protein kinase
MKYCTNCGCEISNKPNFCPSCGAKISYVESTQGPEENIKSDSADSPNKTNSKPDYNSYETVFKQSYKPTKIEKKYGAVIIAISVFLVISMIVAVIISSQSNNKNSGESNPDANQDFTAASNNFNKETPNNDSAYLSDNTQQEKITQRNIYLRNNWNSYISAERSEFTYAEIGGISGLSIIVTNNTEYKLDNVTVQVTIKTVNNYVHKTEMLFFENVKPNSRVEQYVTPTDRGRYVEYEITSVYSDRLNFMWNKGDNTGNGSVDDPWKFNN